MSDVVRFALDGGGTHTRLGIAGPNSSGSVPLLFDSMNPASVKRTDAVGLLRSALRKVSEYVATQGDMPVSGVIASAAISRYTIDYWTDLVTEILQETRTVFEVVLTNDMDGMVLAPPVSGSGGVLVAGTGSGAVIVDPKGKSFRVGGWEYLASDEGSAFWLGRAALVASVRAADGRGAATSILVRIEQRLGASIVEIARQLAERPHPRRMVADLARCVTSAWLEDRDQIAQELVTAAIDELVLLVAVATRQIGVPQPIWALTGGLIIHCDPFAQILKSRLEDLGSIKAYIVTDTVSALLDSVPSMAGSWPGLARKTITVNA